jgi:hypothetical protein
VGIFQTRVDPEWETFLWQQKKTAILVMLFGFLRPGELAQISAKKWTKVEKEGIFVEVEIKSHLGAKSQVFIPIIHDNSINPVYHMELLVANTENRMSKTKGESLEFLFTDPRSHQRLTVYALSHTIHRVLEDAGLKPNNCYSVKSAAVSYLVSKDIPQEQINQALHYRSGKSVMSKLYATFESLKKLPLLLVQSVNKLYTSEESVSPPEEKPEEKYERKFKDAIKKRKSQLSKESEKRREDKIKKEETSELMKEFDKLNGQLENGGLSDSEMSAIRQRKKLVWKRILFTGDLKLNPPR